MPRTAEEVRALFKDMGFEEVKLPRTIELSFERETGNPDVKIRVYSAIEEGGSRECGADAGRVLLVHRESTYGAFGNRSTPAKLKCSFCGHVLYPSEQVVFAGQKCLLCGRGTLESDDA